MNYYSSKIYHGNAIIYLVDNISGCQYRGDMNVLDSLSWAVKLDVDNKYPDIFDSFCRNYWKCGKTFSPCYEYLAQTATIKEVICSKDDCSIFHSEYSTKEYDSFLSVERTTVYLEKLNRLADIL